MTSNPTHTVPTAETSVHNENINATTVRFNASIVLYNTPLDELQRAVDNLVASPLLNRLFLVDNSPVPPSPYMARTNSKPNFSSIATADNRITYLPQNQNLGYGKAHNIAIRETIKEGIPYHLVLNADTDFDADIFPKIINFMQANADVALLQPKIYYTNGTLQRTCRLLPTPYDMFARRFMPSLLTKKRNARYELHEFDYNTTLNVPYLPGCFMFLRTSALQEVGLFDERFFLYPEDIDLTRRLHRHFKTLFFPEVSITHRHDRASYKSLKLTLIHVHEMAKYFTKWGWLCDSERSSFNKTIIEQLAQP